MQTHIDQLCFSLVTFWTIYACNENEDSNHLDRAGLFPSCQYSKKVTSKF